MQRKWDAATGELDRLILFPAELRRLKSTFDSLWESISFAFPDAGSERTQKTRESLAGAILAIAQVVDMSAEELGRAGAWFEDTNRFPELPVFNRPSDQESHDETPTLVGG
jgi:hypothetical protein